MRPFRATKLFVEIAGADLCDGEAGWLNGADGVVVSRGVADTFPDEEITSQGAVILHDVDPETLVGWHSRPRTQWVAGGGLDTVLRLRDAWPDLDWVPRIEVYRPETRFDFHRAPPGEGFSMYMPDTAAIQGFRIADTERQTIEALLPRAVAEGFRCIWLHGRDAAEAGRGADIELLVRVRRHFAGGRIWLSGGIAEPRHLETLAGEGGAKAVVVPASIVRHCGCATLAAALELDPPASQPVATGNRPTACPRPRQSA